MKLNYTPVHWRTGEPFTDEDLQRILAEWTGDGVLYGTQSVYAPDPANNLRDMAVVLMMHGYSLSDELNALLPEPDPIPEDAIA